MKTTKCQSNTEVKPPESILAHVNANWRFLTPGEVMPRTSIRVNVGLLAKVAPIAAALGLPRSNHHLSNTQQTCPV